MVKGWVEKKKSIDQVGDLFDRLEDATRSNHHIEAMKLANQLMELCPGDIRPLHQRAFVYESRGTADSLVKAISDLDACIVLAPTHSALYTSRARCHAKNGAHDLALLDCNRALEIDPKRVHTLAMRATIYRSLNRFDEEVADRQALIQLTPHDHREQFTLAIAYQTAKRPLDALNILNDLIKQSANHKQVNWRLRYSRMLIFMELQRYSDSLNDADVSLQTSKHPKTLFYRGMLYLSRFLILTM